MSDSTTTRRRMLRLVGGTALAGLAGCSGIAGNSPGGDAAGTSTATTTTTTTSGSTRNASAGSTANATGTSSVKGPKQDDSLPKDAKPDDGYPPEFDTVPEERNVDPSTFDTLSRSGIEIRLVPVEVAYYWYARGEARFADARSESEYDVSHVFGAVLSPAGDGRDRPDDPVLEWPQGDRIVTYCDCPHHLSSMRAASLLDRGFERVYAIDEGFGAWRERNYPLAGEDVGRVPKTWTIEGDAGASAAGETAWAYHVGSNQAEATPIADDGTYALDVKFVDVTASSEIRIETPAYTLTAALGDLSSGRVSRFGRVVEADGTTTGGSTTTSGYDHS